MRYHGIDILFTDLLGRVRRLTVNEHNFEGILKEGVGIDGSSLPGFLKAEKSDLLLVPDENDINIKGKKIVMGNIYYCDGSEFPYDGRTTLLRARRFIREEKIADKSYFLPEIEFYIFEYFDVENTELTKRMEIVVGEKHAERSAYHSSGIKDPYYSFRNSVVGILREAGIDFKYHHHEVGPFGQMEIELKFMEEITAADVLILTKEVIKETGKENDLYVTFMPKPFTGHPGTGLHFHQFLVKDEENLFYDPSKDKGLSDVGRWYIGGLLYHSRAVCAFTNPSVNSYRRLCGKYETPSTADYSIGGRASTVRVPIYTLNTKNMRVEYRPPDASANIYFSIAAQLMAGVDGILNRIDPDEVMAKGIKLPRSLEESMNSLRKDHDFLTRGGVFKEELIEGWIDMKFKEAERVKEDIPLVEYQLYFDV